MAESTHGALLRYLPVIAIVALLAVIAILLWQVQRDKVIVQGLASKLTGQASKLADKTVKDRMDSEHNRMGFERICAEQSKKFFLDQGDNTPYKRGDDEVFYFYVNHYNAALGKCFIVIREVMNEVSHSHQKTIGTSGDLLDSFEGKNYGSYVFGLDEHGKPDYTVNCSVTLPSGEDRKCASEQAWDRLTAIYYMQ